MVVIAPSKFETHTVSSTLFGTAGVMAPKKKARTQGPAAASINDVPGLQKQTLKVLDKMWDMRTPSDGPTDPTMPWPVGQGCAGSPCKLLPRTPQTGFGCSYKPSGILARPTNLLSFVCPHPQKIGAHGVLICFVCRRWQLPRDRVEVLGR